MTQGTAGRVLDRMTVRVERRPGTTPADAPAAGEALVRRVKESIGVTVGVEVVAPGDIERSTGKVRRFVDLRPPR